MSKQGATVWIADDEDEFREGFIQKHAGSGFTIEPFTDVFSIPTYLNEASRLPDLVVLDLYRTTEAPGTARAEEQNKQVDVLLKRIARDTAELKSVVDQVKKPVAIDVLREIRKIPHCSDIPVLLYTRQGLSLLSDNELRDAIHLNAEWMLKGRSADIERAQMNSFLRDSHQRRKRMKRDLALTILGAVAGAIISVILKAIL